MWVWGGLAGYLGSTVTAWSLPAGHVARDRVMLLMLSAGAVLLCLAIAGRWLRVGYGPFLTLYEILLSNMASLGLITALIFWRVPMTRTAALLVLPVLLLLGVWSMTVPAEASRLPATYDTWLLWIHVGVGKVFLAICLVATGLAGILLLGRLNTMHRLVRGLPGESDLDDLVWRMMAVAFVFHSLMLIAGAVWAQDAWGRYWDWDPLETSAFLTWLAMATSLHLRLTWRVPPWLGWWLVIAIFVLAFLTFFGLPFNSAGPHRGIL
jgi:ABC-type transport system involved in cytochrome c biogenesis permease subunit